LSLKSTVFGHKKTQSSLGQIRLMPRFSKIYIALCKLIKSALVFILGLFVDLGNYFFKDQAVIQLLK